MKKINILIIVDKFDYHGSYINGPTRNYSWLVSRLDKDQFNVHLFALRKKGRSCEIFEKEGVNIIYLGLGKYNPFTWCIILRLIRRLKIDILQLQGYGSVIFGQIAGILSNKPMIIKEEWVDPHIAWYQCLLERCLGVFITRAIAISEYCKKFLIDKKGIKENKISLIMNGLPLDRFYSVDKNAGRLRRKNMGIPDDFAVVGTVGMLHENKGHNHLIDAAAMIKERRLKTTFLIVGDGELREKLEHQVAELGLKKNVLFMGHQENIPEILQMMDIFVMSSFSETWGTSILEAMAAGRAIITTDSGGGSEMINDGYSGLIVPVKNARILADKIEHLIDYPEVRRQLAGNARQDSESHNIDLTVQRVEDLYRNIYQDVNLRPV
ncbi:glycosyltransferase family 4 protein [Thermodesulfobacteriota bacterium]